MNWKRERTEWQKEQHSRLSHSAGISIPSDSTVYYFLESYDKRSALKGNSFLKINSRISAYYGYAKASNNERKKNNYEKAYIVKWELCFQRQFTKHTKKSYLVWGLVIRPGSWRLIEWKLPSQWKPKREVKMGAESHFMVSLGRNSQVYLFPSI